MSMIISGVDYDDGRVTGVEISGIVEAGVDQPVTAFFNRAVYGKWVEAYDGDGIVCSVCGTDFCTLICDVDDFNFCPHCGADMRKDGG